MKSITVERISQNPLIAFSIKIEPQNLILSEYDTGAMMAIMGKLTNISVERIIPKYRMGRIMSLDITPRNASDPIIIFSPIGNLKPYYDIWSDVVVNGCGLLRNRKIKKYDLAMQEFYQTAEENGLERHEIVFATIEMLKFRNDVLTNLNWQ